MLMYTMHAQIYTLFTSVPELKSCVEFSENSKNSPLDTTGTLVDKCTLCAYTVHKNIKNKHIFVNMVKMWIGTKKAQKIGTMTLYS